MRSLRHRSRSAERVSRHDGARTSRRVPSQSVCQESVSVAGSLACASFPPTPPHPLVGPLRPRRMVFGVSTRRRQGWLRSSGRRPDRSCSHPAALPPRASVMASQTSIRLDRGRSPRRSTVYGFGRYDAWSNATSSVYLGTGGRGNGSASASADDGRGAEAGAMGGGVEGREGTGVWSPRVHPLDGGQTHIVLERGGKQEASPVHLDQRRDETKASSGEAVAPATLPPPERELEEISTGVNVAKPWGESVSLWERLFRRRRRWRRR